MSGKEQFNKVQLKFRIHIFISIGLFLLLFIGDDSFWVMVFSGAAGGCVLCYLIPAYLISDKTNWLLEYYIINSRYITLALLVSILPLFIIFAMLSGVGSFVKFLLFIMPILLINYAVIKIERQIRTKKDIIK